MTADTQLSRMLEWLSSSPSLENVARAIALDYLASYNPVHAMIWLLKRDGSCTCLAQYGGGESYVDHVYSAREWRALEPVGHLALMATQENVTTWSEDKSFAVINLYAQNILIGFLTLRFAESILHPESMHPVAQDCSRALSIYLALRFHHLLENEQLLDSFNGSEDQILTIRQLEVLKLMAQEKTNYQISKLLGYSVSTIRHETMRIYSALGVSDRAEAAIVGRKRNFI
ncbi:unannotated protein [freshwater metagenome]|uniref:Unannotated protein n=1 Tax=freshwater metagenome TaxID=449393 RepID=A0A6J6VLP0_9ZZZZ|nr:hypothetical protein [Actinomycetota bacterium]